MIRIIGPIVVAIALIGIWELWIVVTNVSPFLLPTPIDVFKNMGSEVHILLPAAWATVKEMLVGFGIAAGGGIVLALLIAAFKPVRLTIYPLLVGSQVIPKIALLPVILILFGLGHTSRLIIIVSLAFFPIVISCVVGLNSVEPTKIHLARSLGAGRVRTFTKIRIPQAMPDTFGGLKLAATRAIGAAVIADFLVPGPGLGRIILISTSNLQPAISIAAVGYLVVIGVIFFFIVTRLELLVIPWHTAVRGSGR
jgi:NitT/TauT family transport system permease protein